MQTRDYERFNALMNGMAKTFEREIDNPVLDVYWLTLRDWTLAEFEAAVAHLMQHHKFGMPKPADFTAIRTAGRPTAGEAWAKALAHCESGAWRRGASSGDPRVDATAAMVGGFERIALCETTWLGALERRFCEHYETLQDVTDVRSALPALARDELPLLENTQRLLA